MGAYAPELDDLQGLVFRDVQPAGLVLEDFADGASFHLELPSDVFLLGVRVLVVVLAYTLPIHVV